MSIKQMLLLEDSSEDQTKGEGKRSLTAPKYDRSIYWMRVIVGVLGLTLPPLLVFGWMSLDQNDGPIQGSLSAYYHTGMRDFFVGILVVIGFLLFTYKIAEKSFENRWSQIGGLAAIGVALIPTGIPESLRQTATLTSLQNHINSWSHPFDTKKTTSELLHYGFTFLLVITLFFLCLGYMREEWENHNNARGQLASRAAWSGFHGVMALTMVLAGIYLLLAPRLNLFEHHRVLVAETMVITAFGLSWLLKGADRKVLFGKASTGEPAAAAEQPPMVSEQGPRVV